ncbi:MAG: hypothetical protein EA383_06305 [Spirochaetaceae bacterium]|nr:MAG: hypothetical protein EA383_06305 [Spirochaetaceae bacterium]
MKRVYVAAVVLCFVTGTLSAQAADRIDGVLAEPALRYGSAAYVLLGVNGLVDPDASAEQAIEVLADLGFAIDGKSADDPMTLGDLSLLLMHVFEIDGGLMYTLLRQPRYATRELEFRGVIQGRTFPDMSVNGERGIRIINRAVALREEGRI